MNRELNHKTISVTDPDHAGLPLTLAFPERPGAGGFGVDAGARSRIEAVNPDAPPPLR
jgi:hypothetical protein